MFRFRERTPIRLEDGHDSQVPITRVEAPATSPAVGPATAANTIAGDGVNSGTPNNTNAETPGAFPAQLPADDPATSRASTPLPTYAEVLAAKKKNRTRPSHPAAEDDYYSQLFVCDHRRALLVFFFCCCIASTILGMTGGILKQTKKETDAEEAALSTEKIVLTEQVFNPGSRMWGVFHGPTADSWSRREGGPDLDNRLRIWQHRPGRWMVVKEDGTQHDGDFIMSLGPTRYEFFHYDARTMKRPEPAQIATYKDDNGYWTQVQSLTTMEKEPQDYSKPKEDDFFAKRRERV
ncbi:hypothetical protein EDC01DRAFT_632329 [Geopyxis carbonaria]|nr:hypothetical protein EDC01DRAFT_632329 [Geopyxis carbonaria]